MREWLHIFLLVFAILPSFARTQTEADSLAWGDTAIEQELYELNLMKFRRILKSTQPDSSLISQVKAATMEFINLASAGRFSEANILLESLLIILTPEDSYITFKPPKQASKKKPGVLWSREVSVGGDLWQQHFELSVPGVDSALVEKQLNPLLKLRIGVDWQADNHTLHSDAELITSRDYDGAAWGIGYERAFPRQWNVTLDNQFQISRYKQELNLDYLQNDLSLTLGHKSASGWTMELRDDFRVRLNEPQSLFYPDYHYNRLKGTMRLRVGGQFFGMDAGWDMRLHPVYNEKDYYEPWLNGSYYVLTGQRWLIRADAGWRNRNYTAVWNDSTLYIDHQESNVMLNLDYHLFAGWHAEFYADAQWRQYERMNSVAQHFADTEIKTSLRWQMSEQLSIATGYLYEIRRFAKIESAVFQDQDYYSHGIELSVDFLSIQRLSFSLTDTWRWKRYPHSATNDIPDFTLYTDRNVNSLLFFMHYQLTKQFTLQGISNVDFDRDPYDDQSDARSSMFSLELVCNF